MSGSGLNASDSRLTSLRHAWALLAWTSAVYFLSSNEADNDLWIHLLLGRDILARGEIPRTDYLSYTLPADQPWYNHEWLSQVCFGAVYALGGSVGLWVFKLVIGLLTAAGVWAATCRAARGEWVRGIAVTCAMAVLSRGFSMRPQIFTYCAVAWLLYFLARGGRREPEAEESDTPPAALLATGAAFCLWANSHGGFVFGLLVLLLHAAVPPWPVRRGAWLLAAAALAGTCLNPYGPWIFAYVAQELSFPHPISEWQPIALGDPAQRPFFLLLGLWAFTLPFVRDWRRESWRALLVAGVGFMAFRSQRYTPVLALVVAPPLAAQLEGAVAWFARRSNWRLSPEAQHAIAVLVGVLAGAQLALAGYRSAAAGFRLTYLAEEYPVGGVRFAREHSLSGKMAVPLDWGAYVLWHLSPAVRVSIDSRFATVYTPQVVHDNFELFYSYGPSAAALLEKHPPDLILAPSGSMPPVRADPDWKIVYRDEHAQLYARHSPLEPVIAHAVTGVLPFP